MEEISRQGITPKEFLIYYLDTQFRNSELASFIFYETPVQNISGRRTVAESGAKRLIRKFWGQHEADYNEKLPVVCINCRSVLGAAWGSHYSEQCRHCSEAGKVTETRKAALSLMRLFEEAGIKTKAPIIMHLAEYPLPSIDLTILNSGGISLNKK